MTVVHGGGGDGGLLGRRLFVLEERDEGKWEGECESNKGCF